ncbi:MAG: alkaline phosphatase PhoX [Acidimicrobiia bacterium]
MTLDRRQFLRGTIAGAAALTLGSSAWRTVLAGPVAEVGAGPYGPLGAPDPATGLRLPAGFSGRIIARSDQPVPGTGYLWHHAPDGGAVFATPDGGWIYTSNSEVPSASGGGASAIRFGPDGQVVDAYRVLAGTSINCAGGAVDGKWYSCEEHDAGLVWECDPTKPGPGIPHPELGTFAHEAVAKDNAGFLYLTEDESDGRFYRYDPRTRVLAAAKWDPGTGKVEWLPIPRPNIAPGTTFTRHQVPESTVFRGGEGCWYDPHKSSGGVVYITTKGDNRVWAYKPKQQSLEIIYDDDWFTDPPLRGVDNVTVHPQKGHVLVAEDGDNRHLNICILAGGQVAPLLEIVGHDGSEITGPAFSPDGSRLYFSSQRGPSDFSRPLEESSRQSNFARPGVTYEVTGPF